MKLQSTATGDFGVDVFGGGSVCFQLPPCRSRTAQNPSLVKRPSYESVLPLRHKPSEESPNMSAASPIATRHRCFDMASASPALSPLGCTFTPSPKKSRSLSPVREATATSTCLEHAAQEASAGVISVNTREEFWRAQLDAIYSRRNPLKRKLIPEMLEKYRGREVLLYRKVCTQYDLCPSRFYADPEAWTSLGAESHEDDIMPGSSSHGSTQGHDKAGGVSSLFANILGTMSCGRRAPPSAKGSRRRTLLFGGGRQSWESLFIGPSARIDIFSSDAGASSNDAVVPRICREGAEFTAGSEPSAPKCREDELSSAGRSASSKDPFAFRFATGSTVFGMLPSRQQSRDDISEDADEMCPTAMSAEPEPGTVEAAQLVRRASAEVLATRRILKAKRSLHTQIDEPIFHEAFAHSSLFLEKKIRDDLKRKAHRFERVSSPARSGMQQEISYSRRRF